MQSSTYQGFRLSPQQRQIWKLQQEFPSQPLRVVGSFDVVGDFDDRRFKEALRIVVARHEILRTTFERPAAGIKTPFQVISEEARFFWEKGNLRALSEPQQRQKIAELLTAECKQPLTLDRGPVVRCHVVELANDRAVLLLSLPAICADSQTLFNLASELFEAYESDLGVDADEVAQYADFAEWENELLESVEKRPVASTSTPALPLERRTPGEYAPEYVSVTLDLGSDVVDLLFVAWQSLIARLSGQRDFTIYKLTEARKVEDLRGALGPYDRYVPVECQVADDSLEVQARLVGQQLKRAADSVEYADPLDAALLSGKAVAFDFAVQPNWHTETLTVSLANQCAFTNPFKLRLSCKQSDKRLSLELHYDSHIFDRETCERYIDYLQRLLEAMANATPATRAQLRLESVDILPSSERQRLLVDFNRTARAYSLEQCVHQFFEEQVTKTPTHVAVVCSNDELSYEQLNAQANQIAHLLTSFGVRPGACVGMCLTTSVKAIVALLGILKTGAAYVPLNPEHPVARLETQLAKSEASICLTNGPSLAATLGANTRTIDFERDADLLNDQPQTNPAVAVSPEALAYVIYTSGSTGTPKGVAVCHRNVVNYTQFMLDRLHVNEPLHFAMVSTISADLGNTCLFPSLFSGGCLHILPHDVALEPRLFSDYLALHTIDVLKIAPSHIHALLADNVEQKMLPSKHLILGGEAVSRQLLDSLLATPHSCRILNHYGPTETTVGSLTFDASGHELSDLARSVPIGRPIANTRVYILDAHLRPCPTGVSGELYIGGAGVAAGYLNDPDQTAARFVPDLFSTGPDCRLYRTGDLARWLPEGNIEFLGRGDFQVKVRGYRIELGEIENVLSEHPQVRQAVVVFRRDGGREQLVAYVAGPRLAPANSGEITDFLKQRLPDYMVPSPILVLRAFPTTPNGKVDRTALPAPEDAQRVHRTVVAPQTFAESELAKIWSGLLKIEELSVHDNFFDLGGHSLLATQVVSRIRRVFKKAIPLRTIFEAPTIAKLASVIQETASADAVDLQMELEALESLSDEEAERLLADQEQSNRV